MITVRCSFNCSVADLPNLQSVLAYLKRHSLAKFAQARLLEAFRNSF